MKICIEKIQRTQKIKTFSLLSFAPVHTHPVSHAPYHCSASEYERKRYVKDEAAAAASLVDGVLPYWA